MSRDPAITLTCEKCGAVGHGLPKELGGRGWALTLNRQARKVVRCPKCLARQRRDSERCRRSRA